MKRDEFKSLVKEIIQEVMDEMTTTEEGKQHSMYPKDDPAGTEGGQTSDQKIKSRQAGWKDYMKRKDALAAIHDEPEFQDKLHKLKMQRGDAPLPHKTSTRR